MMVFLLLLPVSSQIDISDLSIQVYSTNGNVEPLPDFPLAEFNHSILYSTKKVIDQNLYFIPYDDLDDILVFDLENNQLIDRIDQPEGRTGNALLRRVLNNGTIRFFGGGGNVTVFDRYGDELLNVRISPDSISSDYITSSYSTPDKTKIIYEYNTKVTDDKTGKTEYVLLDLATLIVQRFYTEHYLAKADVVYQYYNHTLYGIKNTFNSTLEQYDGFSIYKVSEQSWKYIGKIEIPENHHGNNVYAHKIHLLNNLIRVFDIKETLNDVYGSFEFVVQDFDLLTLEQTISYTGNIDIEFCDDIGSTPNSYEYRELLEAYNDFQIIQYQGKLVYQFYNILLTLPMDLSNNLLPSDYPLSATKIIDDCHDARMFSIPINSDQQIVLQTLYYFDENGNYFVNIQLWIILIPLTAIFLIKRQRSSKPKSRNDL